MLMALQLVAACLAALGCFLVLVLLLPLQVELRANVGDAVNWSAAVRPFGRSGPRIPLRGKRERVAVQSWRKKSKTPGKRRRLTDDPGRGLRAAIRFMSDISQVIRWRNISLDIRFGCDDPYETGRIYGMMTPFIHGPSGCRRVSIRVQPVFDRSLLEGRAALDVSLVPAFLMPAFARFGWTTFGPRR